MKTQPDQYKLLQWYPKLPKEWKIYTGDIIVTKRGDQYRTDMTYFYPDEIENNPEYWEKVETLAVPIGTQFQVRGEGTIYTIDKVKNNRIVVSWDNGENTVPYLLNDVNQLFEENKWSIYEPPKDYQILSFRYLSNRNIWRRNLDGLFEYDGFTNTEKDLLLWTTMYEIYSIERVSDGEIFTVGDQIGHKHSNYYITIKKIQFGSTEYTDDEIYLYGDDGDIELSNAYITYPLFTTEDNIEVYEGDEVHTVFYNKLLEDYELISTHLPIKRALATKIFYYKAEAQKWIEEHRQIKSYKSTYSFDEIVKALNNCDLTLDTFYNIINYLNQNQNED